MLHLEAGAARESNLKMDFILIAMTVGVARESEDGSQLIAMMVGAAGEPENGSQTDSHDGWWLPENRKMNPRVITMMAGTEEVVEEEENKEEEEEEITTTMQSSSAMQQSCTHGPRQLFLSSEQGGEGRGEGVRGEQETGGG